MSFSENRYDALEQLIVEHGLRIVGINFYRPLDLMVVVLNNRKVLKRAISRYARLRGASDEYLADYQLLGEGIAVHWPALDEDLSLKGFLQEELASADNSLVA